MYLENI